MPSCDSTTQLHGLLEQYLSAQGEGDSEAFNELMDYAAKRLRSLARKMLARYPHIRRWEETDDVMQAALVRLHRSLMEVKPDSKRAFFGLAATQMRRTLIDLARHYYGAFGLGKNYRSVAGQAMGQKAGQDSLASMANDPLERLAANSKPDDLERWSAFHQAIDQLPTEEQEVINLVWYGGLMQKEVAKVLDISERTVIRRMNRAKLSLNQLVGQAVPGVE